ncbi:Astacin-like metalloprotease toxin [Dinothrombium tinctorium]|uniref:Metalloendopeptidase n=1 Tax=Dinothrombium tinctorium TaxID=1965070 RepID=A0A443Q8F8_9ACAR|nr:Astacin-like metalloprotease toxin [Dinothrombium tinctorium]
MSTQTRNCIKFKERRYEISYVNIFSGDGCYSDVGRIGGSQELSLGRGCQVMGIIIHELFYAVGFYHEHNRSDRDQYLYIY